jgi:hypothetical protein
MQVNHPDHSRHADQVRGFFAGGRHKNGIEQSLRGGNHFDVAARQLREYATLGSANPLKMGLRRGAMERGAGGDLAGYRRVIED